MPQRIKYSQRASLCPNPMAKKLLTQMDDKKTNLAISADVTTSQALLSLADKLGPEICILKTHIDIIEDFSPELISELKKLAQKHQFFIFEDRKFADIGNTVKSQYQGGIYRIADWADITNAHSLPGPGMIQGLAEAGLKHERGLLLLAEISSEKNLITSDYTKKTVELAQQFPDFVIGFISQKKLVNDGNWIYLTPGIRFEEKGDKLGQQYTTPEKAIIEHESDIIIVGRGIINADNPLQSAKKYRDAGWTAYQKMI